MFSLFDQEIYEDEDVRDANNAEKVMWSTIILAFIVIGFFLIF